MKNKTYLFFICFFASFFTGCSSFLDERPRKSLVVPSSLEDLQAILDDYNNQVNDPAYGEISADDYFLTTSDWKSISNEGYRRAYVWEKDYLFGTGTATDWLDVYRNVYAANTVLEKIEEIEYETKDNKKWNDIKGQAFFLRARSFLSIASIWTSAYDSKSAKETLGIPLRMDPDFNKPSKRSSLEETYSVIIGDLKNAEALLPINPIHPTRASKPAALALLARTYLFMRNYEKCWIAANECLELKNDLIDYNELEATDSYPIPQFNEEVIYVSHIATPAPINPSRAKIDSTLYNLYHDYDRRKKMFFQDNLDSTFGFKGSYQGNITLFSGLATDEVYLMRAECALRKGEINEALEDLNTLLKMRLDSQAEGAETLSIYDSDALLDRILLERRKELLMRGIRWPDIKRLNLEGRNIILKRKIEDQIIELLPNDPRYALPIPEQIIGLTDMEQNPR